MSTSTTPPPARPRPHPTSSAAAAVPGVLLVVMWSSGFVGAELGTREAPASTLLAWRYLAAAAVLVAACAWRGERLGLPGLRRQVALGLLCQVGYLGLVVGGIGLGVASGTSALVAALQPMVVAVLAAVLFGERVGRRGVVGLGVALLGVVLVVGGDLGAASGTPAWAFAMPALGMLSLALGTVLQQRWRPPESLLVSLAVQAVTAAVVFWALAGALGTVEPPTSSGFWTAVAWVVVLSTFGGYGAYLHVARTRGASRASTLLYLTPATTMLWAAWMFGDAVTPAGLAGTALCGVGVAATLLPRRRPRPTPPPAGACPGGR